MSKFNENCVQLIRDLIQYLPKDVKSFGHNLMSDDLIGEPIVYLRHTLEDYVIEDVIKFCDELNLKQETDDKTEEMSLKCDVVLDKMWEIINCLDWSKVQLDFRHCFGFISLLKALIEMRSIITSFDTELELKQKMSALKTLDFGLLMSPKLTDNNILAKFAKIIHKSLDNFQTISGKSLPINDKIIEFNENKSFKSIKRKSFEFDLNFETKFSKSEEKCDFNKISTKPELNLIEIQSKPIFGSDFQSLIPYFKNNIKNQIKRVKELDFLDFRDQYLITKTPVIITDCMSDWPAMTHRKWTVDYIERVAAFRTVPIEIGSKYTDEEWTQKLMTIKEFINDFILNPRSDRRTGYLAQHNLFDQIEELMADISVPDYCSMTTDFDSESVNIDINGWFGPMATVSPLHYDPKDNLLAQVFGQKYVRLYSDDTPFEAIYPNDCRLLVNTSGVDLENVDSVKFPNFEKLDNYYECVLKEGEMLFIPKNYWHFVKSLSTSFSVSFWWK